MVPLKVAPLSTSISVMTEITSATKTPKIVAVCDVLRPTTLPKKLVPNKPAIAAPASGARGTARRRLGLRPAMMNLNRYYSRLKLNHRGLTLEAIQVFHIDGVQITEHDHQDREADRRFGGGHGQDEEHDYLPCGVAQVMRERDEVHVHRQQHQFDGHQQDDDVLAVQENTDDGDREQNRAEYEVVSERESHGASLVY